MAAPSGLDAQFCIAAESTPGTFAAPSRALEFNDESIALTVERIDSSARRRGKRVRRTNRTVRNRKGAGGTSTHEVTTSGFGLMFEHALGASVTDQPDAGEAPTVYRHTATIGPLTGKALTVQVGRPDNTGTVRPFSYVGAKVASWELSCEVDGVLTLTPTWDAVDEDTEQTLVTAVYPAGDEVFDFTLASITLGGAALDTRSFSLSVDNALALERYFIRNSSLKREQLEAGERAISGSLEVEFDGFTIYDLFRVGEPVPLVATFMGSTIEGGLANMVRVTLPAVQVDGETPDVADDGILDQSVPFTVLDNGTDEPVKVEYQTADATL